MITRYLGSFIAASLVTFALFFLMQYLVASGRSALEKAPGGRLVDFVRLKKDEQVEQKKRKLPSKPKPPDKPPPAPEMNQARSLKPQQGPVGGAMPNLSADVSMAGGPNLGAAPSDGDILPLVRVPPQYPRRAESAGIEGYVDVEFSISKTGAPYDPVVIESKPPRIFDRAATRAILKWKYKPKIEDGQPVERHGVQVRITFELEK